MALTDQTQQQELDRRDVCDRELLAALGSLDTLLGQAVVRARAVYGAYAEADIYRGLYITDEQVDQLLLRGPNAPNLTAESADDEINLPEGLISAMQASGSLTKLAQRFNLSLIDCVIVLIALAVEVDLRYERIFAYLQDDVTRKLPTVELSFNLLAHSALARLNLRRRFSPDAPLIRQRILRLKPDPNQVEPPLLAHYLKLDEAVTRHLLGGLPFSAELADACEIFNPAVEWSDLIINEGTGEALHTLAQQALAEGGSITFFFEGPDGAEKEATAEALARSLDINILRVRADAIASGVHGDLWRQVIRHAELTGALLYVKLQDESSRPEGLRQEEILGALDRFCGISILAGSRRQQTGSSLAHPIVSVSFESLRFAERQSLWQREFERHGIPLTREQLEFLSARFRLTASQIRQAVATAILNGRWRFIDGLTANDNGSSQPTIHDLAAAARAQCGHELVSLARKIEPRYGWGDIVLPPDEMAQLEEICAQAKLRHVVYDDWGFDRKLSLGKGLNVLFCGPPGTGKTMAAEVIASELSLDLYRIDLSQVVNKYIGETEKNLDRIFGAAENSNAILFFDEADALFGKRSQVRDSHDRYANIEISYLLQKMEEYQGISILATNLRQNLDEAFVRRLQAIVEFPFPDEEHRRKIWQNVFPKEAPVQKDVSFDVLAREIRLAGGNIKNMALAAAFSAASTKSDIGMDELVHAAYREHQKIGCSWAEIATSRPV